MEASESRVLVVAIELTKITAEALVKETIKRFFEGRFLLQSIQTKDIGGYNFGFETKLNVVSEQQSVLKCVEVARRAIVAGCHMHGRP